jgi:hypothetical protein
VDQKIRARGIKTSPRSAASCAVNRNRSPRRRPIPLLFLLPLALALGQAGSGAAVDLGEAEGSDEAGRAADVALETASPCKDGETLATGAPDPALFAREASRGVQAFWCETYDADGPPRRAGAYRDVHPDGSTRVLARYVDSRIEGPVEVFDAEGGLWLRGEIQGGDWTGPLEIFHANGARWLSAHFRAGRLDGPVETRFPDGSLESRTLFQDGREDGLATSYYPAQSGGGLRTRVRVEGDQIVDAAPARPLDASLSQAALPGPVGAPGAPALVPEN